MRTCETCGCEIPAERLEVLPNATTCVQHSDAAKVLGFTFSQFSKGTASELALVNPKNKESLRQAERANGRKR